MNKKAIALLSGGLDSLLAAKITQEQGIKLIGVAFKSYFFDVSFAAQKQAQELNIPLKIIDISQAQFEKVLSPEYGYGTGLNPCVDCHLLMIKTAYQLMIKEGGDFLVTGEVLGQRPLSQNRQALDLIDRVARIEGLVVRPLSAKLLPPTLPEKRGWLDQKKLLAICGRSRKEQLGLAKKFGLKNYTSPAGGCLLTDRVFSKRLSDLLGHFSAPSVAGLRLVRLGRHFWFNNTWVIVGRNNEENERIKKLIEKGDCLIELVGVPGPTTLVRGEINDQVIRRAKRLTKEYAPKAKGKKVKFVIKRGKGE